MIFFERMIFDAIDQNKMKNIKITIFSNYEKRKKKCTIEIKNVKFENWSKNFINITTWNRKRSTRKKIITILKNREHDEFHFTVLEQLIIRKKRLQNIEIQSSKKLKLNSTSSLFEKINFRTESSLWLNRKWLIKILFRHFATEFNSWSSLRWTIIVNCQCDVSYNRAMIVMMMTER